MAAPGTPRARVTYVGAAGHVGRAKLPRMHKPLVPSQWSTSRRQVIIVVLGRRDAEKGPPSRAFATRCETFRVDRAPTCRDLGWEHAPRVPSKPAWPTLGRMKGTGARRIRPSPPATRGATSSSRPHADVPGLGSSSDRMAARVTHVTHVGRVRRVRRVRRVGRVGRVGHREPSRHARQRAGTLEGNTRPACPPSPRDPRGPHEGVRDARSIDHHRQQHASDFVEPDCTPTCRDLAAPMSGWRPRAPFSPRDPRDPRGPREGTQDA
jgi:hypothetical protein